MIKESSYSSMINSIRSKVDDPNETLSAKVLSSIHSKKISYTEFGNVLGQTHKEHYLSMQNSDNPFWIDFADEAELSKIMQKKLEASDKKTFNNYLRDSLSSS